MSTPKPLIAFYGATGGCTLAALAPALNAGYDCTALVRTPSKLTEMLLAKNVPQPTISAHLTISQGDVLKVDDCKQPLTLNGRPADMIISGIGTYTMSAITLCGDAVSNILTALRQLQLSAKPLFVALSTTGITSGPRDVPLLFVPLYHVGLANPHKDKKRMESVVVEHAQGKDSVIDGFCLPRMSLLTNGKALGGEKVRAGGEAKPAVGYTISRDDAGLWIFENVIKDGGRRFKGEKPSITY